MSAQPDPARRARQTRLTHVWVGIQHFPAESIPLKPKVEHVFASEEKAVEWRREGAVRAWGSWREIKHLEIER